MYAEFFGFRELPFNNTPDPRFFFPTPEHEEALASLVYAVNERKGFVLLTGEVGAGKTLMTRMMLRQLGEGIAFANLHHGVSGPRELMECICAEFELPVESGTGTRQLVRVLHDFLLAKFAQDVPVVLVVDEAQNIPLEAFEQLRMIGNLESDQAKLLQVAIVGQTELQKIFLSPQLRQLRQRVFRAFHLDALSREDVGRYIRHRLATVSMGQADVFDDGAIESIFHFSQGVPRIINTLCDNALLSAYAADRRRIDGPFVQSVIEQMMIVDPKEGQSTHDARRTEEQVGRPERPDRIGETPTSDLGSSTTSPAVPIHPPVRVPDDVILPLYERTDRLAEKQAQLVGLFGRIHARNSDLSRQVAALEQRLADKATDLGDARVLHARLQPMLEQARTAVTRSHSVSRRLESQETRLRSLAATIKTSIHQLHKLLDAANEVGERHRTARPTRSERSDDTTEFCAPASAVSGSLNIGGRFDNLRVLGGQSVRTADNTGGPSSTTPSPTAHLAEQVDALLAMTASTPQDGKRS